MLQIKVRSKKYNCDLSLEHKVTVIIGDSGRGKTQLVKALRDRSGGYKVDYNQSIKVVVLEDDNWKHLLTSYNEVPLFIVDDCDFVFTEEFGRMFNSLCDCYLIAITRTQNRVKKIDEASSIPVSNDAVYEMIADGIEHKIVSAMSSTSNIVIPKENFNLI